MKHERFKNKNVQEQNQDVNATCSMGNFDSQFLFFGYIFEKEYTTKLMLILPLLIFLFCGSAFGQPIYGPPSCRDVYTWPYEQNSIWNMPIGSNAQYSPQPVNPNHIDGIQSDLDIIILTPDESDMDIFGTEYRWQDGTNSDTRCIKYNNIVHLSLPIPNDYVTLFYKQSRPNNAGCIMKDDGRTLVQIQPFQACGGGYATSGLRRSDGQIINELIRTEDIDIYGDGRRGMHGGSGLNTMGGAIRLGELTSPNIDAMRHTIKISLPGEHYLYYDHANNTGYRWPATQDDAGAEDDYNGTNPHALQGCLRALKPDLNIDDLNLETLPGKKMAWTLQNYGAYQVEGVPWARMMIATEEGPNGAVVTEFKNTYGYDFVSQDKSGNPWVRDLLKIAEHLHVVTNNYESTPGGGGTPLQPLAPDFCDGTEDVDPPSVPSNNSATGNDGFVNLNWDDNSESDLAGYNMYRSTTSGSGYSQINGSMINTSDYTDNNVTNGTTYYYVVTAVDDSDNESDYSGETSATPVGSGSIGDNLLINPGFEDGITGWTVSNAESKIWYALSGTYSLALKGQGSNAYQVITGLTPNSNYILTGFIMNDPNNSAGDIIRLGVRNFGGTTQYEETTATAMTEVTINITTGSSSTSAEVFLSDESGGAYSYADDLNFSLVNSGDIVPPSFPSNLSAMGNDGSVSLDWDDNSESDLAGYNVYRSLTSGSGYSQINGSLVSTSDYTDNNVTNGTFYYYIVTAVDNSDNESGNSNEASATPEDVTAPLVPDNLSIVSNDGSVILNWDDNSESDLAGYIVYRSITSGSGYSQINASILSNSEYTDNNVINGTTFYYVVTAEDISGNESGYSDEVSITPVNTTSTVMAVNSGGSSYSSGEGETYEQDNYFSGGNTYTVTDGISGTLDDLLYQSERYGNSFSYNRTLPDGDYEITLKFAEIYQTNSDRRVFDVAIEGTEVISNLDIFAQVGHDAAYDWTGNVTLNDGELNIVFTADVDNAKVSSILVKTSVDSSDTASPLSPSGLSTTSNDGSVSLNWDDNSESDLAGYNVYRSTSSGGSYSKLNGSLVINSNYTDNNVSNGTTYYYVVTAEDDSGNESDYSNEVSASPESTSTGYEENFEAPLNYWIENPDSRWFISNNSYSHTHEAGAGNDYAYYNGDSFSDYTYFAEIIPSWNNNFGVIFNLQDGNNYYLLDIDADPKNCLLKKVVNGNTTTIASSTYSVGGSGQEYVIGIYNNGINTTANINGEEVFSTINDDTFSGGKIGLWASYNPLIVDNISVVAGQNLSLKSLSTGTAYKVEELMKIKVYPNPVGKGDDISLFVEGVSESAFVILYDVAGNDLYQAKLKSSINTIPGDKLDSGMYLIQIINEQKSISHKVIIEK